MPLNQYRSNRSLVLSAWKAPSGHFGYNSVEFSSFSALLAMCMCMLQIKILSAGHGESPDKKKKGSAPDKHRLRARLVFSPFSTTLPTPGQFSSSILLSVSLSVVSRVKWLSPVTVATDGAGGGE